MQREGGIPAGLGEVGPDRVHQEWHGGVPDFEQRIGTEPPVTRQGGRVEPDVRHAWFAHGEQRPGIRGELGKLTRIVTHEIFGNGVSEERGDEVFRHVAIAASEDFAGGGNERRFGAFFIRARKVNGCHYVIPRRVRRSTLPWHQVPTVLRAKPFTLKYSSSAHDTSS